MIVRDYGYIGTYHYEKELYDFKIFKHENSEIRILQSIKNCIYEWTWKPEQDKTLEQFARHLHNMYYEIVHINKERQEDEPITNYVQERLF